MIYACTTDAVLFTRKPAQEGKKNYLVLRLDEMELIQPAAWKSKYDRFTDVEIIATTLEVSL